MSNPREKAWSTAEMSEVWADWRAANLKPQWIKCSERMPEDGQLVLGYSPYYGIDLMQRQLIGAAWYWADVGGGVYAANFEPTHWQPLPEPPEGDV